MTKTQVRKLEKDWYRAYERRNATELEEDYQAEQKAYDKMYEAKNELDLCHQFGCLTVTKDYAYCPEHRETDDLTT